MNIKFMQKILGDLNNHPRGRTIKNIMDSTKLARGTIKPLLDILVYTSQAEERIYGQNVKVYFANVKRVKKKLNTIK
ncbi:hypothetical protein LCGC14_2128910 [marine sediment metagenome]|uniref:Uncharacterized protein n=1 Tax=marine sediment metagenome TaxID=412755 RepID=A0A0F9E216_9ZZZZ